MDARGQFGRNVARLRASRGLSQVRLALLLDPDGRGVSQSYVSQLEAGKRDPKLTMLVALAIALKVPVTEVVAGCEVVGRPTEPVVASNQRKT